MGIGGEGMEALSSLTSQCMHVTDLLPRLDTIYICSSPLVPSIKMYADCCSLSPPIPPSLLLSLSPCLSFLHFPAHQRAHPPDIRRGIENSTRASTTAPDPLIPPEQPQKEYSVLLLPVVTLRYHNHLDTCLNRGLQAE